MHYFYQTCSREPGQHMLLEQRLVGVSSDQFALQNEKDWRLFSIICHNAKDHYFSWCLWEQADLHILSISDTGKSVRCLLFYCLSQHQWRRVFWPQKCAFWLSPLSLISWAVFWRFHGIFTCNDGKVLFSRTVLLYSPHHRTMHFLEFTTMLRWHEFLAIAAAILYVW
jgi:hypothetical protein